MLETHIDPHVDLASRRPETIAATVDWISGHLALGPGSSVLDLGCGPGLYCRELAIRGMAVTGVDFSERSVAYAREQAAAEGLRIEYVRQNYLEIDYHEQFDAILLIFGDFCVLPDDDRDALLAKIRRALRPGGAFVLDVTTRQLRARHSTAEAWSAHSESGFWRPKPHLVLQKTFDYPGRGVTLEQFIIVEGDGPMAVYRVWSHDYSPDEISSVLAGAGFEVESLWGDLIGTPLSEEPDWIGVVARRPALS